MKELEKKNENIVADGATENVVNHEDVDVIHASDLEFAELENNEEELEEEEASSVVATVCLERRIVKGVKTNDGRPLYNYFVAGVDRGHNITAQFEPKDSGGYQLLSLIYEIKSKADLVICEESRKDEKTKKIHTYMTYECQNVDEDGYVYSCAMKPSRSSDKEFLKLIIKNLNKENKS